MFYICILNFLCFLMYILNFLCFLMYILILLTILNILYTLTIKYYISTQHRRCILYVIILEIITLFYYIKILENTEFGITYSILKCLSILTMTILSVTIFNECITPKIMAGISCLIIAIILLSIK